MFNFFVNQHLFLSLARENSSALQKAIKQWPTAGPADQWLNFLRHHDELTLDKLSEEEKKEVFKRFGPKAEMQIFDRGIRRRLAAMVKGDQTLLRLYYSLMMSLPGVPMLRYGDEIGMGELPADFPFEFCAQQRRQFQGVFLRPAQQSPTVFRQATR